MKGERRLTIWKPTCDCWPDELQATYDLEPPWIYGVSGDKEVADYCSTCGAKYDCFPVMSAERLVAVLKDISHLQYLSRESGAGFRRAVELADAALHSQEASQDAAFYYEESGVRVPVRFQGEASQKDEVFPHKGWERDKLRATLMESVPGMSESMADDILDQAAEVGRQAAEASQKSSQITSQEAAEMIDGRKADGHEALQEASQKGAE